MTAMLKHSLTFVIASAVCGLVGAAEFGDADTPASKKSNHPLRVGAAQPRSRLIDWRLTNATEVLERVDTSLAELEQIIHKAGAAKCDVLALPEDTLGLGHWEAAHKATLKEVLPDA